MQRSTFFIVAIATLVSIQPARADVLVLDACVKQCDDDDLRVIGALRAELAGPQHKERLIADPRAVLERLGDGTPLPAMANPSLTPDALTDALKAGLDDYTSGRYEQAAERLARALDDAAVNPALVVSDPSLRNLVPRAIVGRAVSLARQADASQRAADAAKRGPERDALAAEAHKLADAAQSAMTELVRITPEPSILDSRGPEADRIFQAARDALAARGKGSLVIQVDDPSALFYLDEAGEPHQSLYSADLLPGRYRVLVRDPRGRARRYAIEVVPQRQTLLDIRWSRDAELDVISARRARVGFTYASEAERAEEPAYVRHVGALAHSGVIVVIGRVAWRGAPAMFAVSYDGELGTPLRAGVAPLGDLPRSARELVAYLESPHAEAPLVTRLDAPPWLAHAQPEIARANAPYELGYAASGALVVAGAVLVATDRRTAGYITGGLGLGLAALTTVLYVRRGGDARAPQIAIAPLGTGVYAAVGWSF